MKITGLLIFAASYLATVPTAVAQTNSAAKPAPPPPPGGITVLHDVVTGTGGGRDLHAEIAYPATATGPLPAVIFVHGGGWIGGSNKGAPILALAQAGYFAASIEYRLSGEAKWPAQIQDCKLGVRWLRANAAKYNVDPNRIGAWGGSAGGHLVACLGTMADVKEDEGDGGWPGVSSAVQAVVDFYGPTDLTPDPTYHVAQGIVFTQSLFGGPFDDKPDLYKSASPALFVKAGDPPMLIVQGENDTLVLPKQSTDFDAALTKAGVPHQLILVKGAGHGFWLSNPHSDPTGPEIGQAVSAFLAKYLKAP